MNPLETKKLNHDEVKPLLRYKDEQVGHAELAHAEPIIGTTTRDI